MPWPAFAEWVWQASPSRNTLGWATRSRLSKPEVRRWPTSYTECQATSFTSSV